MAHGQTQPHIAAQQWRKIGQLVHPAQCQLPQAGQVRRVLRVIQAQLQLRLGQQRGGIDRAHVLSQLEIFYRLLPRRAQLQAAF